MTKTVCDLCGEPIENDNDDVDCEYKIIIKRHWSDPYGSAWYKLDAHQECIEAVAAAARERNST